MPIRRQYHWSLLMLGLLAVFSNSIRADKSPSGAPQPSVSTVSTWNPDYEVGAWIWAGKTFDQQTCRFWKSFEIPRSAKITSAHLRLTVDNSYRVFLDGREIGQGGAWEALRDYNLIRVLDSGTHVLAVEGFNDYNEAGLTLGLRLQLSDGRMIKVASDETWRIVPTPEPGWEKRKHAAKEWPFARIVAAFGDDPWRDLIKTGRILSAPPVYPITTPFWKAEWFQIALLSVCGIAVVVCLQLGVRLASQSRAQRLLHEERARIARDIHDDLGATLTKVVLLGEVAQSELPPGSGTRAQIDQLCEKTRGALRSMNEIVWVVNSRRDTVQDFTTYICKYAQAFLQSTPIRCRLDIQETPDAVLELPVRRSLFLAVKEAIHNAVKYSEATELWLRIHREGPEFVVIVEDNGKGFNPEADVLARNGLSNMWERASEVGGRCRVFTQIGAGCRVEFKIPVTSSRRRSFQWARTAWDNLKARRHSMNPKPPAAETAEAQNCESLQ
jgi:signal transduction histidine kinase